MRRAPRTPSSFGQRLRHWRKLRGVSQLELAHRAGTTPRHVSFIETGRSRPGAEVVLRIAEGLDLPVRERNALLEAAGLAPAFAERELDDAALAPFLAPLRTILERHEPFPGAILDARGRVRLANAAHRRLLPGAEAMSAEEGIDAFYGETGPRFIENWSEVAWTEVERRRSMAERSASPDLHALADRAEAFLTDVPRPRPAADADSAVVVARFRVGDEPLETFTSVLRFDTAREVTLSEIRLELLFPKDERSARRLAALVEGA